MEKQYTTDSRILPVQIGPYLIEEMIGKGGMGIVYRGRHSITQQTVAVKTVYVPTGDQLEHIRREIHALAKIRHPGIVRIVAEGMDDGLPYYAMELLDGTTLNRHPKFQQHRNTDVIQAGSVPNKEDSTIRSVLPQTVIGKDEPTQRFADIPHSPDKEYWLEILTVVRRLCSPLSFLHGEGIVHRDLKPENILVLKNGLPIIFDFGVSAQFAGRVSREKLDVGGLAVGTLLYMSPEQIRGEFVDARADLYSLGCIIYELICGEPPFVRNNMIELIRAHLHENPVPLSKRISGFSQEIDDLVLHLLAKKPQERLGYADDLARILTQLGASDQVFKTAPKARDYLYRPAIAGRETLLETIRSEINSLSFGSGRILLLGGETGVGKTRLAMEISREAQNANFQVLTGECLSVASTSPSSETISSSSLHPLRRLMIAIIDYCRNHGKSETDRIIGKRGKILALYEPAFMSIPGVSEHPEPVELPGEAAGLRVLNYFYEMVELYTEREPTVLILDDLQWADGLTFSFIEFLLQVNRIGRMSLLIVCTYRSEEAGESLHRIIRHPDIGHFVLSRLEDDAVRKMVQDTLAISNPPDQLIEYLVKQSEGNPFFVAEYLRTAVSIGLLFRDNHGRWRISDEGLQEISLSYSQSMPLPQSLREIIIRRLNRLPRHLRPFIESAAVIGREINRWLLLQVCDLDETDIMELFQIAKTHQILESVDSSNWRFAHDKIREVVYGNIEPATQVELHRLVAENIQILYEHRLEEYCDILGYHWEKALKPEQARQCYLSGARHAIATFAFGQSETLYSAYFRLLDQPDKTSERVRCEYAENVLLARGRVHEAIFEFRKAVSHCELMGDLTTQGIGQQGLASCYRAISRMDEAWIYGEKSLRIHQKANNKRLEGLALSTLALISYDLGNLEKARILSEQALAIHQQVIDRKMEGITLGRLGFIHADEGYLNRARSFFEQALAIHRETNNRREEAGVLGNVTQVLWAQGKYRETLPLLSQALTIFQEVGDIRGEGMILTNLSKANLMLNDLDQASNYHQQAISLHRQGGERGWEAADLINYSAILLERNEAEEAEKNIKSAVEILQHIGEKYSEGKAFSQLGIIQEEMGKVDQARASFKKSIQLFKTAGDRQQLPHTLYRLGKLDRLTLEDPAEAEPSIMRAESIFKQLGHYTMVGICLCERGHLALSQGLSAQRFLDKARAIASMPEYETGDLLLKSLENLENSVSANAMGVLLYRGESIQSIPTGIKRWMIENNRLVL